MRKSLIKKSSKILVESLQLKKEAEKKLKKAIELHKEACKQIENQNLKPSTPCKMGKNLFSPIGKDDSAKLCGIISPTKTAFDDAYQNFKIYLNFIEKEVELKFWDFPEITSVYIKLGSISRTLASLSKDPDSSLPWIETAIESLKQAEEFVRAACTGSNKAEWLPLIRELSLEYNELTEEAHWDEGSFQILYLRRSRLYSLMDDFEKNLENEKSKILIDDLKKNVTGKHAAGKHATGPTKNDLDDEMIDISGNEELIKFVDEFFIHEKSPLPESLSEIAASADLDGILKNINYSWEPGFDNFKNWPLCGKSRFHIDGIKMQSLFFTTDQDALIKDLSIESYNPEKYKVGPIMIYLLFNNQTNAEKWRNIFELQKIKMVPGGFLTCVFETHDDLSIALDLLVKAKEISEGLMNSLNKDVKETIAKEKSYFAAQRRLC